MGIWVLSGSGPVMNKAALDSLEHVLCSYSFFVGKYLEVKLWSHRVGV